MQPRCHQCVTKNLQCAFSAPRPSQQRNRNYKTVLDLLHGGSRAEADEALRLIRTADDVDAAVDLVAEAQLLLAATSAEARPTQPGPSDGSNNKRRRRLKSPFVIVIPLLPVWKADKLVQIG